MGGLWIKGYELVGVLSELVGYKLGLVVDETALREAVQQRGLAEVWPTKPEKMYRYRSEEVEELTVAVLAAFGDPDAAHGHPMGATLKVWRKYGQLEEFEPVIEEAFQGLNASIESATPGQTLDLKPVLTRIADRWGSNGARIAEALFESIQAHLYLSPWSRIRRQEFTQPVPLTDLFHSHDLPLELGVFFDQRFIDYLHAEAKLLSSIHWRQFEGLIAEFLRHSGLAVELGPGRNDDGVDIRAWREGEESQPAVLVVQCKRQQAKIDRAVVKALAADVSWEGAQVGLLATTSEWSPAARRTIQVRSYPVLEANRDNIRQWIRGMRTPSLGVWLSD